MISVWCGLLLLCVMSYCGLEIGERGINGRRKLDICTYVHTAAMLSFDYCVAIIDQVNQFV